MPQDIRPRQVFGSEKERRNVIPYLPKGGQKLHAEMPFEKCPLPSFLGQKRHTEMPQCLRPKGRIQHPDACYVNHMSILPEQFTGGQPSCAAMPMAKRPHHFYLVPRQDRKNAITVAHQGKGQDIFAEMPCNKRPSQPVTGGHSRSAEMPSRPRPHLIWVIYDAQKCHSSDYPITRGHPADAEMSLNKRLATKKEVKYG